jgi:arylsulfatase A-like enzyme
MKKQPNILFVMSDQHNAKLMGHKGHPNALTPNLDRMAGEGVRFDNAITQNPICTPSRMCFLTGQYPHNHGYYGLEGPNPQGLPTILGHFRNHGYKTAAIGKIHCPEYFIEEDCDYFCETAGCSIGGNPKYVSYLKEKGVYETALSEYYKNPYGGLCYDGIPSKLDYRDSEEGFAVTEAISFMKSCATEGRPFFAHVSFSKPHQLYTPAKEFWDMYDDETIVLPPNVDYEMVNKAPNFVEKEKEWRQGEWVVFEPKTYEAARIRKMRGYLGCITQVDHAVGELLNWLDKNNLKQDTIVIYTSDHGDYACEHGLMEKAPGISSDAITRVPYIWRYNGQIKEGHVAEEIVESVDLSTTLCSLAGIDPLRTSDGSDMSALLRGENKEIHRIGVTEFVWSKSVRKGKYRYIYYPIEMYQEEYPQGFGELYDLEEDPWEMHNLYFDSQYSVIVLDMQRELLDWLVTTTRPVTVLPAYNDTGDTQAIMRYGNAVYGDGKIHPGWIRNKSNIDERNSFLRLSDRKNYI